MLSSEERATLFARLYPGETTLIRVVHFKQPHDIYIGRPSLLGNPYTHLTGKTQARYKVKTREEAIASFERYAWERMHQDKAFCDAVLACEGKTLGCFCKPKSCHGDCFERLIARWKEEQNLFEQVMIARQGALWT